MGEGRGYGEARRLEHEIMQVLALIVSGRFVMPQSAQPDQLRQLGYAAQFARGRVADPDERLATVIRACCDAIAGLPLPKVEARDKVQASWGVRWHVDAEKLKTELHLYVADALKSPPPQFYNLQALNPS